MISVGMKNLKTSIYTICILSCFFLTGCGGGLSGKYNYSLSFYGFILNYSGDIDIEGVPLKNDDLYVISDLYQEVGDDVDYKDSLLIAKSNSNGLGANTFSRENLDSLESQGLTVENINRTQITIKKSGDKYNAVLVEYEITEGLITEIPRLYVSQLFIPKNNDIILMSYITEDLSSRTSASNMFKNIK